MGIYESVASKKEVSMLVHKKGKYYGHSILLPIIAVCILFTSCYKVDGPIPSKSKVMKYTEEICPSESIELISIEELEQEGKPHKAIYTFRSLERDLTFTVTSTLKNKPVIDGVSEVWYEPVIWSNYVEEVMKLYYDALFELFTNFNGVEVSSLELSSFGDTIVDIRIQDINDEEELSRIINVLIDAKNIISEELSYNDEKWLTSNGSEFSLVRFWIYEESGEYKHKFNVKLYGSYGCSTDDEIRTLFLSEIEELRES